MHMIATNLAVWLNVLIQETKHEILTFYDPYNRTLRISHRLGKSIRKCHTLSTDFALTKLVFNFLQEIEVIIIWRHMMQQPRSMLV